MARWKHINRWRRTREHAITAALHDPRFPPVRENEFEQDPT
ncbi:MAG: AMMECR1 domain-containing protein [Anaerolineales bacterium]|nr:AMMECR1 domain-containing protein [Anaerolineales bacterium]